MNKKEATLHKRHLSEAKRSKEKQREAKRSTLDIGGTSLKQRTHLNIGGTIPTQTEASWTQASMNKRRHLYIRDIFLKHRGAPWT